MSDLIDCHLNLLLRDIYAKNYHSSQWFRHLNINLKLSKLRFLSPVSSLLILCLVLVVWMRLLMYCCYQMPWTWGLKTPSPSLAIEGLSLYLWSNVTNIVAVFCKINIRFWKTCTGFCFFYLSWKRWWALSFLVVILLRGRCPPYGHCVCTLDFKWKSTFPQCFSQHSHDQRALWYGISWVILLVS